MNIIMPQLGETVSEGTIAAWHVKVGDQVKKDQPLMDVETDKASIEVPSPVDGTISQVLVAQGETVDVGIVLAVIDDGSVETASIGNTNSPKEKITEGEQSLDARTEVVEPARASKEKPTEELGLLSPAVRRLLREHDISASTLVGTGRDGRVTRNDVLALIGEGSNTQASKEMKVEASNSDGNSFSRVQKITAQHMLMSKQTSPHVLQSIEVDFTKVDIARLSLRVNWKEEKGYSLTYLPFIAKALCDTLRQFPRINASIENFESNPALNIHQEVNLGIAVALDNHELVVPVIHSAGQLGVSEIAASINELSTKARNRKLSPDLIQKGTYTVSNNGSFGTLLTAPIINQPQVAILSVDQIKKQPVVIETADGDVIAIRTMGILSQSFDHRIIDGAYSGGFLAALKLRIERSDWLSEF
jgi:pyruvate dehydrogenase E2 component (dihydrolipoamide acetyltransferase)